MSSHDWTLVYNSGGTRAWTKRCWRLEQYSPTGHFHLLRGHKVVSDCLPSLTAASHEIERLTERKA
jgi:hypothetical protein